MRRTEELFALAEVSGIEVAYECLRPVALGLYVPRKDAAPVVLLDTSLLRRERWLRATLAHELGHHFTGAPGWLVWCQGRAYWKWKAEAAAQRWALEYLMPDDEFVEAAQRGERVDELAEWFGVPESWVVERMRLLAMMDLIGRHGGYPM